MDTLWNTTPTKEPILKIWRDIKAREQLEQSLRASTTDEPRDDNAEDSTN